MRKEGNKATGKAKPPTPLTAAAVAKLEAAKKKVWRTRDGAAFASRAERRAYRASRKVKAV